MARRYLVALAALVLGLSSPRQAEARNAGTYLVDPGGRVSAVRALDVNADGRLDLVVLVQDAKTADQSVLVMRTPSEPVKRHYYPPDHVNRIVLTGDLADAGAMAVGRFGPKGEARLRFLGPKGIIELQPDGMPALTAARTSKPTLFGRSPGRLLVIWDGVADLDGDGIDEMWFPLATGQGRMYVIGGTSAGDRALSVEPVNRASTSAEHLLSRHTYVPNLFPADVDGDGTKELLVLDETELVAWFLDGKRKPERLKLPFLEPDPKLGPEDQRTPRIQAADVNGDGFTDLLVTLITGKRTRLESLRTILFHYPGPFRDPKTGGLVTPRARLDTESIVLHPTFVDLDGDGKLDYVGDSIRGNRLDIIARLLGKDPTITFVGFRFDPKAGTFENAPYFTIQREYASAEALSNRFGRSADFAGDFDGDGHTDLLDLGNLEGVEVLRGVASGKGAATFAESFVPRIPVKEGLTADSLVVDLNGDGRADAVLWSKTSLYFLISKGSR